MLVNRLNNQIQYLVRFLPNELLVFIVRKPQALLLFEGVVDVIPGYAGEALPDPTYQAVCTGRTGHAEVVQVRFDPAQISIREILEVFISVHDPTMLNRQGADIGTQYHSAIFTHNAAQAKTAQAPSFHNLTQPAGDGIYTTPMVLNAAPKVTLYVQVADNEGYITRVQRTFSILTRRVYLPAVQR